MSTFITREPEGWFAGMTDSFVGHRQITDAYLAQLARARGGQVVTFDRGMAKLHSDVAELIADGR